MRYHTTLFDTLATLVAIPSVFPEEGRLSDYLAEHMAGLGFRVQKIATSKGRNNLVATFGNTKKYLAFYGHMDTVAPDKQYAARDPFTMWVEGDRCRGLGVADMKGGIAAILDAAAYAVRNELPVKVIFGVDEENISAGAHDLVDAGELSNVGFIISAESGQVRNRGQQFSVCFGRRGRIAVRVTVKGKKSHAAMSHEGVNAIDHAGILLTQLPKISFARNPRFGKTDLIVHEIRGATDSFSVPDECTFTLSALTTPPTQHQDVLDQISGLVRGLGVEATVEPLPRPTPYGESYEVDRKDAFIKTIESEVLKSAGVEPIYSESVADENIFANRLAIPVISLGPVGGNDHTADEWVDLQSLERVLGAYKSIINLYNGSNH